MRHIPLLTCSVLAAGCGGRLRAVLPPPEARSPGPHSITILGVPPDVERPAKLVWGPVRPRPQLTAWGELLEPHLSARGLQMAAWRVPGEPFLFCLVRNPSQDPATYPSGPGGLGWWEWTTVRARVEGAADFRSVRFIPEDWGYAGMGPR
ncbi:MAG: hypothetical protein ACYTFI_05085, partial [Planctomycetota bacterium]